MTKRATICTASSKRSREDRGDGHTSCISSVIGTDLAQEVYSVHTSTPITMNVPYTPASFSTCLVCLSVCTSGEFRLCAISDEQDQRSTLVLEVCTNPPRTDGYASGSSGEEKTPVSISVLQVYTHAAGVAQPEQPDRKHARPWRAWCG